ncbi:MAG: dephospho-CoA kinase [Chloroflexi bacterium]|nr:dephospho-CoA kinase [Chloroflexota bacterium]
MPDSLIAWAVMLTIGLTGGIGSGKSAVANLLQQLGASIIDADRLGHEAYTPDSEAWRQVVAAFGEDIVTAQGEIDRRKLGAIVFADPDQLARLNGIMHPLMAGMVAERKARLKADGESVAVVEAAVLFEAGWDSLVDEVWTTNASTDAVVERLRQRSGLSEEEARKRINSQMPAEERNRRSDVVVDNSADLAALERAVSDLWQNRVKGKVHQGNG